MVVWGLWYSLFGSFHGTKSEQYNLLLCCERRVSMYFKFMMTMEGTKDN